MSANLPYLTTPGTLVTALNKMKAAATPSTFTHDFVQTKLKLKGGAGRALVPYMKKIGFVASDGSPTFIYQRFRNNATSGAAVAESMRLGYKPLYEINEYAHELSDKDFKGLVVQVTGHEDTNRVVALIQSTFTKLKSFADFETTVEGQGDGGTASSPDRTATQIPQAELGFNIAYTINLNLPPTTNIEVFNAIFKSLKENLLRGE